MTSRGLTTDILRRFAIVNMAAIVFILILVIVAFFVPAVNRVLFHPVHTQHFLILVGQWERLSQLNPPPSAMVGNP